MERTKYIDGKAVILGVLASYIWKKEEEKHNQNTKRQSRSVERKRKMAGEEGQVIACHTVEAWNEQLQKGNDSKTLVIWPFLPSSSSIFLIDLVLLRYG